MEKQKKQIPNHWKQSSWDEKAKENPLYAIMTTAEMTDAGSSGFSEEHLSMLFAKGRKLFNDHIAGLIRRSGLPREHCFLVEFGCGAGRILNAVVEAGYACAGIDISETMLALCSELVPGVKSLHRCDPNTCATDLPDAVATHVYSYAVVQHIASLTTFRHAVAEMMRLLKPGGFLALQVNCEDFTHEGFERPGRTENFETYSVHYKPGQNRPYHRHEQNNWSGVYIGFELLKDQLAAGGMEVIDCYYHNPNKKRAIWVISRKVSPR